MTPHESFKQECQVEIEGLGSDQELAGATRRWMNLANARKYSYHFEWLGRPIIQYPQDIVALQEVIWAVQPDLIIETGIAHGGSLVFHASMLALLDVIDAERAGKGVPAKPSRRVLGIDIDIRAHNLEAIRAHPMARRIDMIQGSSTDADIVAQVVQRAQGAKRVLVCLDSNHTHEHVLAELRAYGPLVSAGSYCVVMDTVIENLPEGSFPDRPWDLGDNPMTAVHAYLKEDARFQIDSAIDSKILISVAPQGFLRRTR